MKRYELEKFRVYEDVYARMENESQTARAYADLRRYYALMKLGVAELRRLLGDRLEDAISIARRHRGRPARNIAEWVLAEGHREEKQWMLDAAEAIYNASPLAQAAFVDLSHIKAELLDNYL